MRLRYSAALAELHAAVEELAAAAAEMQDEPRAYTARWLARNLAQVDDRDELRACAREALGLYRGGMGSFQDVGDAVTDHAVTRLRRALHAALDTAPDPAQEGI